MEKETVDYLQKNIDRLDSIERDRADKLVQWTKHIITILIGLLSVLVAFKSNKSASCLQQGLYSSVLIVIGLSILSGFIYLYHIIDELNKVIQFQRESLSRRLKGDFTSVLRTTVNMKWYYKIFRVIFYASSILSIIALVIYGIILTT